jgi:hypothetical protein
LPFAGSNLPAKRLEHYVKQGVGFLRRIIAAASAVAALLLGGSPATMQAQAVASQFFPYPGDPANTGFVVGDEEGIPFLTTYRRLGGMEVLGRPISHRFEWHGFVCQLTERSMLQWDPESKRVRLANTTEILSEAGLDDVLYHKWALPHPAVLPEEGRTPAEERRRAQAWLEAEPAFAAAYRAVPNPEALYGLPTSPPANVGSLRVMRFQRSLFYRWIDDPSSGVAVGVTGTMLVDAGVVPAEATTPQPAPAPRATAPASRGGERTSSSANGPVLVGVATWYGDYFHGRVMRNGERYNMWDPTTLACNSLPLGTMVRVTHRGTGESIVARVTDTGAFKAPIVVDLSRAGFAQLADNRVGVIPVTVEVVR